MQVRVDKWLQVARVFKTRSQATKACVLGRVQVNGTVAKPHRHLEVGDEVEVQRGDWPRILKVAVLRDKPVRKEEAPGLYEDLTPPPPPRDPVDEFVTRPGRRERGSGRPTKRERREIDRWRRH